MIFIKKMTDHERFNELLNQLGDRKDLADYLGLSYGNIKNMLMPSRNLPTWAKSMLYVQERWQNKNRDNPQEPATGDEPA